jgi:hypothetical protein
VVDKGELVGSIVVFVVVVVVDGSIVVDNVVGSIVVVVVVIIVVVVVVVANVVVVGTHPLRIVSRRLQSGHNEQVEFKKQFISLLLSLSYNTHVCLVAGTSGK